VPPKARDVGDPRAVHEQGRKEEDEHQIRIEMEGRRPRNKSERAATDEQGDRRRPVHAIRQPMQRHAADQHADDEVEHPYRVHRISRPGSGRWHQALSVISTKARRAEDAWAAWVELPVPRASYVAETLVPKVFPGTLLARLPSEENPVTMSKGYYAAIQLGPDPSSLETVNVGAMLFCPEKRFPGVRPEDPGATRAGTHRGTIARHCRSPQPHTIQARPSCTWRSTAIHVARATASNVPASP